MRGKITALAATGILAAAAVVVTMWEGKHNEVYLDPVGIPTVCYGHTGPGVKLGLRFTNSECDALLREDLLEAQQIVKRCIRSPMRPHQEAALTSAAFNVGPKVVCGSTLGRKANASDWVGACAELDRWKYANGRVFKGLILRRADERALCEGRL